ncbi:MAG: hypothetical protein KDB17_20140, partial [Ilumatobacter sp.]|nr:hypothetical protein [Ilumatobacter sp.]
VMANHPAARGEVFNITGDTLDVNRYVKVLAEIVGAEPDVRHVPDALLPELNAPGAASVYGHLFKVRHHAMFTTEKAERLLGWRYRYDVVSGHRHTYDWFLAQGWDRLDGPLADP